MSVIRHNEHISFGIKANCTLAICPLESSILGYRPNVPANAIFLGIFVASTLVHAWQGYKMKMFGFMGSMIFGGLIEILGYVGRLMLYDNPFDFAGFQIQIICITIAPIFYCSAIYVLLSQIIHHIDPSLSHFNPQLFYWTSIPSDIISLVLQAAGGGLSCVANTEHDVKVGEHVSMAGLVLQIFTLVVFIGLFLDYVVRAYRSPNRFRFDRTTLIFIIFCFNSIIAILIRCLYRVVELSSGYDSKIFRDEGLFIALESVAMCFAVIFLNVGHPGPVLGKPKATDSDDAEGSLESRTNTNTKKEKIPIERMTKMWHF